MSDKNYDNLSTEEKLEYLSKNGLPGAKNLSPNKKGSAASMNFNKKGYITMKENRLKREALKHAVATFGTNKLEATEDLTSLETLKIIRNLFIAQEDWDKVVDISKVLAEYEAPKKSRVEEIKSDIDFNDFKEEDVEAYLTDVISLDELRAKKKG